MHKTTNEGVEACYLVKDSANSLTVDGYTVIGRPNTEIKDEAITGNIASPVSFGNTTYMSVSEGFAANGNGGYISSDSARKLSPVYFASDTAVAGADGRAVARASEEDFVLMSLTEQGCQNGEKSYLLASASVDFASGDAMQSATLGNSRAVGEILRYMGKDNAPSTLVPKPMGETDIATLTTNDATIITVVMVALPMVTVTAIGTVVIVRRKNR